MDSRDNQIGGNEDLMDTSFKIMFVVALFMFALGLIGLVGSRRRVYFALILPFNDGSGSLTVLGAYHKKETAEAKIYRYLETTGVPQPSAIIECVINSSLDEQEPPPKGALPMR
jgi:hypothetical protein